MLPIVQRELRVVSRKKAIYLSRSLSGFISATFVALLLILSPVGPNGGGQYVFSFFIYLAALFCGLEGVRKVSDAVSEEKREGTLGLLFLTDLRGYDIILGKLAAHSLRSFHALLAFLPVLAITLLLGGTTLGQFWRAAAVLVNALFVSLAIGIWISTLSTQRSLTATLGILFAVFIGPLPLAGGLTDFANYDYLGTFVRCLSPFGALALSGGNFARYQREFWAALLVLHLCGWLLVITACYMVASVWMDKPARARKRTKGRTLGPPEERQRKRQVLLDKNAVLWLTYNERDARFFKALFFGLFGGAEIVVGCLLWRESNWADVMGFASFFIVTLLGLVLKIYLASQATLHFAEARQNGAFELMLSTPLTVKEIISGHWLALRKMFLLPAMALLTLSVGTVVATLAVARTQFLNWIWLKAPVDLGFGLVAIGWFGMWMGLTRKSANTAFFHTLLWTIILPPTLFACIPNILIFIVIMAIARDKLLAQFRKMAAEKFYKSISIPAPPLLNSSAPPLLKN